MVGVFNSAIPKGRIDGEHFYSYSACVSMRKNLRSSFFEGNVWYASSGLENIRIQRRRLRGRGSGGEVCDGGGVTFLPSE